MKPVVRAFVFNSDGEILFARHKPNTPWVLPGWHVEDGEALHEAMVRELSEEFDLSARFFDIDTEEILTHKGKKLTMNALPIASYDLTYTNSEGKDKSRTEYVFLMETDALITKKQDEEIIEYAWFEPEKILSMKPNSETWDFYQEILEKIIGEDEIGE
jgi:ADP-ribose pyrophosphatase YjhB (NUDIX family)